MSEEKENTVSKEFVNAIKKWVTIDNNTRELKEKIKILTNEKKEFEKIILQELDQMNEKVIEITDGKLRKNITKSQTALKKDHIHKTLNEYTKDENKTKEIIDYILKSRPYVEKISLKRTKAKESISNIMEK